ncbi:MAG TPA: RNA polymerase sigma factor [Nocardioidaceae bacterium]|nr:RNA polymerase sigma factor [Nocardioidaceae bacterium]
MATFEQRLAGAKAGDEACFVELFRSIQPALLRYLATIGGSLAEDVASETWVSVVKGLGRFNGNESGWRAWVFTIARSRLYDAQRRAGRGPDMVDDDELESWPDEIDVAAEVEELFSTEVALALIRTLPKDQAEAVLLRHVAGLDVSLTAKVLDKRPGAVRVAAHRGLKRLSELLSVRAEAEAVTGCNDIETKIGK